MNQLARCVAFIRAFDERRASRLVPFTAGVAHFDDELPRVYDRNFLSVDLGARPSPDELVAEADRMQSGLAHRKVTVDDEHGRQLEPAFRLLGWRVRRLVVMCHRGATPSPDFARTAETSADTLAPIWAEGIRSEPFGADEDVVRQLVAAQRRRQDATAVRYFVSLENNEIASYCELFSDGETSQIESVMTLPQHRQRGHGRAVVERALAEALSADNDLVFLLADDEDWPKDLYARLGFEPVGFVWDFVREPAAVDVTRSG
jgi:ribosomal protein S18 acetylase RimI-like enzyme